MHPRSRSWRTRSHHRAFINMNEMNSNNWRKCKSEFKTWRAWSATTAAHQISRSQRPRWIPRSQRPRWGELTPHKLHDEHAKHGRPSIASHVLAPHCITNSHAPTSSTRALTINARPIPPIDAKCRTELLAALPMACAFWQTMTFDAAGAVRLDSNNRSGSQEPGNYKRC